MNLNKNWKKLLSNKKKIAAYVNLILSLILIIGMLFALVEDLDFFITRKEGNANIISINYGNSRIKIYISYFNNYLDKIVYTTISAEISYKNKIQELRSSSKIYYPKRFPKSVYFMDLNVPQIGILIFEALFTIMMLSIFLYSIKILNRHLT
jgi:hypothetical protein